MVTEKIGAMRRIGLALLVGIGLLGGLEACGESESDRTEKLLKSVASKDATLRWGAVQDLGKLTEPSDEAVKALKKVFSSDPRRNVRAEAVLSLEKLGKVDEPLLQKVALHAMEPEDYLGSTCFSLLKTRGAAVVTQLRAMAATPAGEGKREKILKLANRLETEIGN